AHPSSDVRSAAANESSPVSWSIVARTSGSRSRDRSVARTRYPSSSSRRMTCPARNPDPPVTSTMSVMVRLNLFLQQFGPEFDRGRGDAFLGGRVADDSGGPEFGLGRHVALPQLQPGDLA